MEISALIIALLIVVAIVGVFTLFSWIIAYLWFAFVTVLKLIVVGFIIGMIVMFLLTKNGSAKQQENLRNEPSKYSSSYVQKS